VLKVEEGHVVESGGRTCISVRQDNLLEEHKWWSASQRKGYREDALRKYFCSHIQIDGYLLRTNEQIKMGNEQAVETLLGNLFAMSKLLLFRIAITTRLRGLAHPEFHTRTKVKC